MAQCAPHEVAPLHWMRPGTAFPPRSLPPLSVPFPSSSRRPLPSRLPSSPPRFFSIRLSLCVNKQGAQEQQPTNQHSHTPQSQQQHTSESTPKSCDPGRATIYIVSWWARGYGVLRCDSARVSFRPCARRGVRLSNYVHTTGDGSLGASRLLVSCVWWGNRRNVTRHNGC